MARVEHLRAFTDRGELPPEFVDMDDSETRDTDQNDNFLRKATTFSPELYRKLGWFSYVAGIADLVFSSIAAGETASGGNLKDGISVERFKDPQMLYGTAMGLLWNFAELFLWNIITNSRRGELFEEGHLELKSGKSIKYPLIKKKFIPYVIAAIGLYGFDYYATSEGLRPYIQNNIMRVGYSLGSLFFEEFFLAFGSRTRGNYLDKYFK